MDNRVTDARSRFLLWGPALIALIFYFWSSFQHDLSRKEAREGIPIVNMLRGESIWLPKINDERYRTKPPMFYWAGLMLSKGQGKTDKISLRLPSVLAGAGAVFLTTLLGFWLYSPATGALAGVIIATSLRFSYLSTHARIDMLFTFFILLAWTAFWRMMHDKEEIIRARFSWLAAAALGFAFLTKGPLGLIFPLLSLFIYSQIAKVKIPWARLFLVPLAMTALWVIEGSIEGGNEFKEMIYRETIGRITNDPTIGYHNKPFYFYFILIAYELLPWSFFLPVVLWQGLTVHRKNLCWIFPAVAMGTLFIFLSFIPGKRGAYLVPIFPMAALLIAHGLSVASNKNNRLTKGWSATLRAVVVVLFTLAIVLFSTAYNPKVLSLIYNLEFIYYKDRWMAERIVLDHFPSGIILSILAAIVLFFALAILRALKENSAQQASYHILGLTFLILLIFRGPISHAVNLYSLKPFGKLVGQIAGENPLIHAGKIEEDLLYFIGRPVQEETTERAVRILKENPKAHWVILSEQSKGVIATNPDFQIVLETNRRLRRHFQLITKIPTAPQK
jgi:4-amino-4-deoxy-L-arabinose transferase-like glycosyltransferase